MVEEKKKREISEVYNSIIIIKRIGSVDFCSPSITRAKRRNSDIFYFQFTDRSNMMRGNSSENGIDLVIRSTPERLSNIFKLFCLKFFEN